jgi:hypothetical protein
LILARDGRESRHDDILRHLEVRHGRIRQMLCAEKLGPARIKPRIAQVRIVPAMGTRL